MNPVYLPFVASAMMVLGTVGIFSVDMTNGRIEHMPKQNYSDNLSYNYRMNLGAVNVPSGKQINAFWITGSMKSDNGNLNGIVFDLTNNSTVGDVPTDPTRVRAIIGQVTTTGAGSVRGIHATAIGAPGSTGAINALNGEVHPSSTTQRAYAIGVQQTGEGGIADGVFFGSSQPFRYGLNMAEMATYSQASIYLPLGEAGAIQWANGTKLFVDEDGTFKVKFPDGRVVEIK